MPGVMLRGKVAVVTGAATGIGKATTETLLHNGAKVSRRDVNGEAGTSLKTALDQEFGQEMTIFFPCNVESDKDVKDAFQTAVETIGGIDIVYNNAGVLNEGEWEKSLSVNLAGVIRVSHVALEHMNQLTGGRGGAIINVASVEGLRAAAFFSVYSAAKHGVVGFTQSVAVRLSLVQTDLFTDMKSKMGRFSHFNHVFEKDLEKGFLHASRAAKDSLELTLDVRENGLALVLTYRERNYVTFPKQSKKRSIALR